MKSEYLFPKKQEQWRSMLGAVLLAGALLPSQLTAATLVTDPADMGDSSGDIRTVGAYVRGGMLYLTMTVEGLPGPSIENTPAGMVNRYYYHWLLDTDNNPATGRSNSEYEGSPTGLTSPIGSERVVMVGWRDGKPNGVEIYDALDDNNVFATGFTYQISGNSITAAVPLSDLGLTPGQTIGLSAFQEGASEDWKVDWVESATFTVEGPSLPMGAVSDPADMGDTSGDIRGINAYVLGDHLFLSMTLEGIAAPTVENTPVGMVNRYYYHWLLDTDNNPATGRSNSEYEGSPTGLTSPIGSEVVVMVGWRDGKPNGVEVYDALDDNNVFLVNFSFQASGNTLTAMVPLSVLGVARGQTVGISAFQEGASEDWKVDWIESDQLVLDGPTTPIATVSDPTDMGDSSGDIHSIAGHVWGDELVLTMTVAGIAAPSIANTPSGMVNRYYYHWLVDADNNPATGRSNSEYEGSPTGLSNPVGSEVVVMVGWRDGKPNGVEVYDALDDNNVFLVNFPFHASGNTLTARVPLSVLGVTLGQTVSLSAFQEGASEDWKVDWIESDLLTLDSGVFTAPVVAVDDPQDMGDSSGDIKRIEATIQGGELVLRMQVYGTILPSVEETPVGMVNRYYYHWLLDTDDNPATGRSNSEYEGNDTNLERPIGTEVVVQVGWRDGAPNGIEAYEALSEASLATDFEYALLDSSTMEVRLLMAELGLTPGQTIAVSAFQEGASEDWKVDWVESEVITLSEGAAPGISIDNEFTGTAYGYEIKLTDDLDGQADENSAEVWLDGTPAAFTASKAGGVTTITGKHAALLEAGSIHTLKLSIDVGGETQSREYVFTVDPYTVLPTSGMLGTLDEGNKGFLVYVSQLTQGETVDGLSLHENMAELAEKQLRGEFIDPFTGEPYFNETYFNTDPPWKGPGSVQEGVINWYDSVGVTPPEQMPILNFEGDTTIPDILFPPVEGLVLEILTYLELTEGSHKLGVYTEGGHKVTAGLSASSPVVSIYDNEGDPTRIPTYFARNQFFDVVAPQDGYYPIRVLWFQSRRRQEPGLLFEFFSVKNRALHLVNDSSDPLAINAYRAGILLTPGVELPTISMTQEQTGLTIRFTGTLEGADTVDGQWIEMGTQSPIMIQTTGGMKFFRAKNE